MALPKLEIKSINPTKASIEVDGEVVGNITIALHEQETIEGIDNAIVLTGDCENVQDNSHHGFVFSVVNVLASPEPEPVLEPEPELESIPKPVLIEPKGA